jgi:hypothetical protein
VLKAPAARGRPASLLVEINPVGPYGAPTEKERTKKSRRTEGIQEADIRGWIGGDTESNREDKSEECWGRRD